MPIPTTSNFLGCNISSLLIQSWGAIGVPLDALWSTFYHNFLGTEIYQIYTSLWLESHIDFFCFGLTFLSAAQKF
jgi:hypothetical protein